MPEPRTAGDFYEDDEPVEKIAAAFDAAMAAEEPVQVVGASEPVRTLGYWGANQSTRDHWDLPCDDLNCGCCYPYGIHPALLLEPGDQ